MPTQKLAKLIGMVKTRRSCVSWRNIFTIFSYLGNNLKNIVLRNKELIKTHNIYYR